MRRAKLFNNMDTLGVVAVLVAYLNWASYQVSQNLRSEGEVDLAIVVVLILGLAYRFGRRRVKPVYEEVASRVILLLSGVLVFSGWATESVALVAGANLWFLLEGAHFSERDLYAYQKLTPLLYLLLVLLPPAYKHENLCLRWIVGIYLILLFIGETQEEIHGDRNPYEDVVGLILGVMLIIFLPSASIALLVSPRSATPEAQTVERIFAGVGLCLLLIVAALIVWQHRRSSGQSRPSDSGVRAPLSPVPTVSAGNAQKLPEE